MLPRAQRLTSTLDFSRVVRRGARFSTPLLVMHIGTPVPEQQVSRWGFVVSKAVGSAPRRNRVKRQLRAIAADLVSRLDGDVVVRALPASASASWGELHADATICVQKWEQSRG